MKKKAERRAACLTNLKQRRRQILVLLAWRNSEQAGGGRRDLSHNLAGSGTVTGGRSGKACLPSPTAAFTALRLHAATATTAAPHPTLPLPAPHRARIAAPAHAATHLPVDLVRCLPRIPPVYCRGCVPLPVTDVQPLFACRYRTRWHRCCASNARVTYRYAVRGPVTGSTLWFRRCRYTARNTAGYRLRISLLPCLVCQPACLAAGLLYLTDFSCGFGWLRFVTGTLHTRSLILYPDLASSSLGRLHTFACLPRTTHDASLNTRMLRSDVRIFVCVCHVLVAYAPLPHCHTAVAAAILHRLHDSTRPRRTHTRYVYHRLRWFYTRLRRTATHTTPFGTRYARLRARVTAYTHAHTLSL